MSRSERQDGPRRAGDRHVWSWCSHVNTHIGVSSQNGKPLDPVSFCPSAGTAARVGWRVLRRTGCPYNLHTARSARARSFHACLCTARQLQAPSTASPLRGRARACAAVHSLLQARSPGLTARSLTVGHDQRRQPPPPLPTERTPPVKPPLPHPTHSTLARHSSADRGALLPSGRLSTTGQPAIVASSDPGLSHSEW